MLGNGDSTLIVTPTNKTILIDGGNDKIDVLMPYLLDRKIKKIDYIIISHFDSDHCNGLISVLENLDVRKILIAKQSEETEEFKKILAIIKQKNIPLEIVKKNDKLIFDKYVYADILYPENKLLYDDLNNNSIVAKIYYGKFSIMFTGDIQEEAEKEILDNRENLKSNILKIAHHRSEHIN